MVRAAPNELSSNSAQSGKGIYGFRQDHEPFIKSQIYDGGTFASHRVHNIIGERDAETHSPMRKYLSHTFSDRSLNEHEVLVSAIIVKFVDLVGGRGKRRRRCCYSDCSPNKKRRSADIRRINAQATQRLR